MEKDFYYTIKDGVPTKHLITEDEASKIWNDAHYRNSGVKLFDFIYEEVLLNKFTTKDYDCEDDEEPNNLFCYHTKDKVEYITENEQGKLRFYIATKHPENLTDEERHRVLEYRLGRNYDKDEIVNYVDLFLQFEFVEQIDNL